jgi:hypothetical protein
VIETAGTFKHCTAHLGCCYADYKLYRYIIGANVIHPGRHGPLQGLKFIMKFISFTEVLAGMQASMPDRYATHQYSSTAWCCLRVAHDVKALCPRAQGPSESLCSHMPAPHAASAAQKTIQTGSHSAPTPISASAGLATTPRGATQRVAVLGIWRACGAKQAGQGCSCRVSWGDSTCLWNGMDAVAGAAGEQSAKGKAAEKRGQSVMFGCAGSKEAGHSL